MTQALAVILGLGYLYSKAPQIDQPYRAPTRPLEGQLTPRPVFALPAPYATVMPTLPPGTAPAVKAAVEKSFAAGTLTDTQAKAVSQLYAPLYYAGGSTATYADIIAAGPGGLLVDNRVDLGPYGLPGQLGTVVDFGTPEAAQAALDAYNREPFY